MRRPGPVVVCVIGKKKSGKTTHVVALVEELVGRGRRVMTAKHGHHFRIDHPETDSWKHRVEGGASRVALAGPEGLGVFGDWPLTGEMSLPDVVRHYLWDADIVVAEGFKAAPYPKVEVFRYAADPDPLYGTSRMAGHTYLGVFSDRADLVAGAQVWPLSSDVGIRVVADLLEAQLLMPKGRPADGGVP